MFGDVYKGKRVLVIGHTGFKGSWLCAWLDQLGSMVYGFSTGLPTNPSHFAIIGLQDITKQDIRGDIRDREQLNRAMQNLAPDFVFHLAAQSLVRRSYAEPAETFESNTLGTMNVLECIRRSPSVQASVLITSDKCYRNLEWPWGYRETDILGGEDPYSASKGCAELIVYSYWKSFFYSAGPSIASARAGNVIGGGDWAPDRIVPDTIRSWSQGEPVVVRNPLATRPWQHVLEPLSGYLWLGAKLLEGDMAVAGEAFNFGPDARVNQTVEELISSLAFYWKGADWKVERPDPNVQRESNLLKLCCDKALSMLGWRAVLTFPETVEMTARWYRTYYGAGVDGMADLTRRQIAEYVDKATKESLPWTR